ncbi:nucleotidyltransferase family protein [Paraglaciecola aestuariivivens]
MSLFNNQQLAKFLVQPKEAQSLSLDEWAKLILILRESKLLASLYHSSLNYGCFEHYPQYAQKHLLSASIHAKRQNSQVHFESENLNELLTSINVQPIYLKGANYILRESRNSFGRMVSDIDILVNKDELDIVEAKLKSMLWKSDKISDYDEKYYRKWAHEIPPLYHVLRSTVLDVHHNLYLPISGRSPNVALFLTNNVVCKNGSTVLGPAETVLHSIIHLFLNEDFTNAFRDLFDLYWLIEEYGNNSFWQQLHSLAQETKFEKELYYCLALLIKVYVIAPPSIYALLVAKFENPRSRFFIEHILYNAITPKHSLLDNFYIKSARALIFLKGHWLKMPLHILIKHLAIKSYFGIVEFIFGKHFLDKD